ncbi:Putative transport system permease protein [Olavius algarvensis associated proteobacterium Delta 3]|nr:Putative transport system permease protein [Olavius algarvensis associated proteobacterium Delta 3]
MKSYHKYFDLLQEWLPNTTDYNLPVWAHVLVVVFAAVAIWIVSRWVVAYLNRRVTARGGIPLQEETFLLIRKGIGYTIVLLVGTNFFQLFKFEGLEKLFSAAIIIALVSPARQLVSILIYYLETYVAKKTRTKIDNILFDLLKKLTGVILYATAFVIALDLLGINIMPFVAGAGVAGVAIGFAAKETLSNLIAGIMLIIDRPFEVGDRIEVWSSPKNSATWGDVIDIGFRATKIRTTDSIVIIIPNNEIMMRDIINYTTLDSKIRVRINIGIAYDADIEKAKKLIVEVAQSADWITKHPPPKVEVVNFGASSVALQARVWINDARRRINTITYITDGVKTAFDREGIEIPYPKRDIRIVRETDAANPE